MKPVDQSILGGGGNCYAACLASILELRIEDVPNFCVQDGNWLEHVDRWLRKNHRCTLLGFRPKGEDAFYCVPAVYHIMCGKSSRDLNHAVVGYRGQMVHDPHPSRDGLVGPVEEFEFLWPLDDRFYRDE